MAYNDNRDNNYHNPNENYYDNSQQMNNYQHGQDNSQNYYGNGQMAFQDAPFARTDSFAQYLSRVFLLMFLGLAITTGVAVAIPYNMGMLIFSVELISSPGYIIFAISHVLIAVLLGVFVKKMNTAVAMVLFIIYSIMTGFLFSTLGLVFKTAAIWKAFLVASIFFGAMALYGVTTKRDLSNLKTILLIALLALIVVSIINIFLRSDGLDYLICLVGVVIFSAYTAYDVNKLKTGYYATRDGRMLSALAVNGAFQLYLDFINLLIYLLRIFGRASRR